MVVYKIELMMKLLLFNTPLVLSNIHIFMIMFIPNVCDNSTTYLYQLFV